MPCRASESSASEAWVIDKVLCFLGFILAPRWLKECQDFQGTPWRIPSGLARADKMV